MRDRLNYRTTGDPKRPALLLVHGFLSSNAQWQPNLDLLGERFFVVLAELWGHGDSPLPADDSAFTIPRYVAEFEHIRNELNLGCWGVVGQSYAAGLAINYAIAHPERVVHHQRGARQPVQKMRRGYVMHVERRVLAEQDNVEVG